MSIEIVRINLSFCVKNDVINLTKIKKKRMTFNYVRKDHFCKLK